jgi:hypothetical protein
VDGVVAVIQDPVSRTVIHRHSSWM